MWTMYSFFDILLELLLATAVFAVMLILNKKWENQRNRPVVDDTAAPKVEEDPTVQDKTPPLAAMKSQKSPDKLSVIVKIMRSEKPLVIESSPSDRVIDVKLKIQEMEGTHVNMQRLIFCGSPLHNQSVLKSCGVVDGSVMHFVNRKNHSIQLIIKTLQGTKIVVECDENDTVEDLKRKIEIIEGILLDQIRLLYAGKQLEDELHLHRYNMEEGSVIHMVLRLRGGFYVKIRISDGRSLILGMYDTIMELKHMIYEKTQIPVHKQELSLDGNVLEDGFRREDYNIEGPLDLIIRERL